MHVFKLGAVTVSMTKTAIEESQVHLQVRKGKATLTADEFQDLHEWFKKEDARLVRKSLVRAKEQAPVFALGKISALSGDQLGVDRFGTREVYVKVVSLRPLTSEDPKGRIWSAGLGFKFRKLTREEEEKPSRKRP